MKKSERTTAQSGNIEESKVKRYNFYCRSTKWIQCYQGEMTEEEAVKYAKDTGMRFDEVTE